MWKMNGHWNVFHTLNNFLIAYVQTVQDPVEIAKHISCFFNSLDTHKININYFCVKTHDQFATNFPKTVCNSKQKTFHTHKALLNDLPMQFHLPVQYY